MSWELIKSIQKETDLRLILPFGLNLQLGDVINVGRDGDFTLEGNCCSLLGIATGPVRPPQDGTDIDRQSGQGTTWAFHAAGKASTLFPDLPSANAGFDIKFERANGWVLALTGRRVSALEQVNRFRQPILDAYRRKVWLPDWALVTSIATTEKMTLLASSDANTQVAMGLAGKVAASGTLADLNANASILASNKQLLKSITTTTTTTFCAAIKVKHGWFQSDIGTLAKAAVTGEHEKASDQDFWESAGLDREQGSSTHAKR